MKKIATIFLVLAGTINSVHAETMYIQSNNAVLLEQPAFQSQALEVLKKGTSVNIINSHDQWVKIKSDTSTGWIFKFLLADHPPIEKIKKVGYKKPKVVNHSRKRASSALANDEFNKQNGQSSDYYALANIESMSIRDSEVIHFLATGPQIRLNDSVYTWGAWSQGIQPAAGPQSK